MKKEKILITGATGGVGEELLDQLAAKMNEKDITVLIRSNKASKKLLKKHPNVRSIYGDITNYQDVEKAVEGQDIVMHLAALIPTKNHTDKELISRINTGGTKNVVEAMTKVAPNAFLLYSSSVATYGDRMENTDIGVNDPLCPEDHHDFYAVSKIAAEKIIRDSSLNWSIYRLAAIMGVGNHKINPLMFHMPLDTPMEYATVRDTARAFVNSIDHLEQLNHNTYNLGGGKDCLLTYEEFLTNAFDAFGLGKVDFPEYTFAKKGFHCGYYIDGHELEDIIHFRRDTNESYFKEFRAGVPGIQRFFTKPFSRPVKKWLTTTSEPYKAYKANNIDAIQHFFGEIHRS